MFPSNAFKCIQTKVTSVFRKCKKENVQIFVLRWREEKSKVLGKWSALFLPISPDTTIKSFIYYFSVDVLCHTKTFSAFKWLAEHNLCVITEEIPKTWARCPQCIVAVLPAQSAAPCRFKQTADKRWNQGLRKCFIFQVSLNEAEIFEHSPGSLTIAKNAVRRNLLIELIQVGIERTFGGKMFPSTFSRTLTDLKKKKSWRDKTETSNLKIWFLSKNNQIFTLFNIWQKMLLSANIFNFGTARK